MSTVCPRHTDKILTTAKSNNYQQSEANIVLSQMQQRPGPCKSEKNGWSYIKYQLVNLTSFLQCPDIILPSQFVDSAEWVEAPAIERFVLCKESDRSSHLHLTLLPLCCESKPAEHGYRRRLQRRQFWSPATFHSHHIRSKSIEIK
jgi:hypothetical protein